MSLPPTLSDVKSPLEDRRAGVAPSMTSPPGNTIPGRPMSSTSADAAPQPAVRKAIAAATQ